MVNPKVDCKDSNRIANFSDQKDGQLSVAVLGDEGFKSSFPKFDMHHMTCISLTTTI